MGELRKARSLVEKALQIQKDMGFKTRLYLHYISLSMIDLGLGEYKSAQSLAEKALKHIHETKEKWYEGITWAFLGRVLGKKDPPEFEKAEEYILKGIQILTEKKLKPWASEGYLYLGDLYNDLGRKEEALENLKKAEGMFQEMGMDYWLNRTKEVLERV